MYFGSVKFFKHLIIGVLALLIIIPCAVSVILGMKLSDSEKETAALKEEIGAMKFDGKRSSYSPDEMFELYKEALEDKAAFLNLLYTYDSAFYKSAEPSEESSETAPEDDKDNIIEAAATFVTTESEEPEEADTETTAQPIGTESTEEEVVVFDVEDDDDAVHHDYESLYPELYAEDTKNVVYNADMDYVYLTFDDGPSKYTENILYYLDLYNIKATFFVVPDGSETCNARLKRIADSGHTIGIHTATHEYDKIYASVESYLKDFKEAYDIVYEATGIKCSLFRFPGGSINDYNTEIRDELISEMTRRGFVYFDWNVDSNDAMGATWTEMYTNVLTQTADKNRAVILMHDFGGGYNTVLVLEDIIRALISDARNFKLDKLTVNVKPIQF